MSSSSESRWPSIGFFLREMEIGVEVADLAVERGFTGFGALFERLALLQQRLGLFLVLPEIGRVDFYFECG